MKKLTFIFLGLISPLLIHGQKATISISYTATFNSLNVQLDSIKITNDNQGNDTTLYGLDTILILDYTTGLYDKHLEWKGPNHDGWNRFNDVLKSKGENITFEEFEEVLGEYLWRCGITQTQSNGEEYFGCRYRFPGIPSYTK